MNNIKSYVENNRDRFLSELIDLLKIPSVSADSKHKPDMLKTAEAVKKNLLEAGCDSAEICETPGHPVVYGEKIIDKNLPTVLVYGHYDVQPPDPLDLWNSPPFDPVIKETEIHPEGAIFARGACDDKGQMYMHVKALEYMTKNDALPCNVKFMIEGEEEVGSEHLAWFIENNREKLQNDVILISDTGMIAKDTPSITTGLRGLSYMEVEVTGPNRDLHSGLYGGAVANPINVLSKMIASLQDEDNRITIPGFYDNVKEYSEAERAKMAEAPFDLEEYKKKLDIADVQGEKGYSTLERASIRPTLDVNGIWGGYIGEGAKTVLPSKAYAKISMRLVSDQDWENISELFTKHFESLAPKSVKVKVTTHHGGQAYVTPIDTLEYQAANDAYAEAFGKDPIPQHSGGSIPIVSLFEKELKSKTILMGFGFDTDAIHSPNEHFGIWNYLKGIETIPLFYKHFTKLKQAE
ncbi:dipeptidase [Salegentibacter flavus]|uniref:Acetylornithine deacetylase/Succinyl-diaminopimelate desuccinylase n=1 Tax=Salegentibacter flavus TaxID=287099 RepID=A0A1I4XX06_9FLAO|nr:dipeptidase [Salegentibacter flavus]SFN30327.1 Acetylornithine deacetylase/Succinyl-diaminopimelate desuccinylase [Salegentibacter flavus]